MTNSRHALLRAALTGTAVGAVWGVLARLWMRLLTTTPEFSWAGTMFIVGLATVFGLCVGVAAEARREGRRARWLLVAIPGLLLFASQGLLFLPGCVVAAVALSRRSRRGHVVGAAALCVVPLIVWRSERLDESTMLPAPLGAQVAVLVGMPLLGWVLSWHARDLFRRAPATIGDHADRVGQRSVAMVQSGSPERALSSLRSDSSREVPAGPA